MTGPRPKQLVQLSCFASRVHAELQYKVFAWSQSLETGWHVPFGHEDVQSSDAD